MQRFNLTQFSGTQRKWLDGVVPQIAGRWREVDGQDGVSVRPSMQGYGNRSYEAHELWIDELCWMTTNPEDLLDHAPISLQGKGSVLLTGLGMGLGVRLASMNSNVTKITVVEQDIRVLNLMLPFLSDVAPGLVTYVLEDAETFTSEERFDYAYLDHQFERVGQETVDRYRTFCDDITSWREERDVLEQGWR